MHPLLAAERASHWMNLLENYLLKTMRHVAYPLVYPIAID
jgi:hypothetical protein